MINQHLDDNIIQAYTCEGDTLSPDHQLHIDGCELCQAKAEGYRMLFTRVAELPAPAFDFDLPALVMQKIVHEQAVVSGSLTPSQSSKPIKIAWPLVLLGVAGVGVVSTALYFLQDYFTDVLVGLSSLMTVLVIITIILIAAFLGYDEVRKYNKQMNSLDF